MSVAAPTNVPPAQPPPTVRTAGRSAAARASRKTIGVAVAQLVVVLILLGPIIWMYVAAFRPDLDIRSGHLLPIPSPSATSRPCSDTT